MARLAFHTFGILHETREHPRSKGFYDRLPHVFTGAENSRGYIDRAPSRSTENPDPRWGDHSAKPRFFIEDQHSVAPATVSLWDDLESVYAFAYYGRHAEALGKRKEWFREPHWPTYVAWWVDDDHIPSRQEAAKKLEQLHDQGATPKAFDFKTPFDANGHPYRMNRDKIRECADLVNRYDQDDPTRQ